MKFVKVTPLYSTGAKEVWVNLDLIESIQKYEDGTRLYYTGSDDVNSYYEVAETPSMILNMANLNRDPNQ